LDAVKHKWDYLCRLKSAIEDLHKCSARYLRTQSVDETVHGETVWIGDVEVFALTGHPKAKRCYAWRRRKEKNVEAERFVVMLKIPPVISPETAVRISITANVRKDEK
jgi:predicted phosphohydrolase